MNKTLSLCLVGLSACSPLLTPLSERQLQPLTAETRPARVVWLVDRSGSLLTPVDPEDSACPANCGPTSLCPANCPTRHSQLVAGLGTLANALPATTTHAAVFFPTGTQCGAPTQVSEGLTAAQVAAAAATTIPIGGTPTAQALQYVASLPARAVETFVVLLTDGVPNCNPSNPNQICTSQTPQAITACQCTGTNCSTSSMCSLGCLDDLSTVNASHALVAQGLQLLVIGLGADLSTVRSSAPLSALEMALPRTCVTAADCSGGGSCSAGLCSERVFLTERETDYEAPALRLAEAVRRSERCTWWLPREVLAKDLVVSVGGAETDDWSLTGAGAGQRLVFGTAACAQLLAEPTVLPQVSVVP